MVILGIHGGVTVQQNDAGVALMLDCVIANLRRRNLPANKYRAIALLSANAEGSGHPGWLDEF